MSPVKNSSFHIRFRNYPLSHQNYFFFTFSFFSNMAARKFGEDNWKVAEESWWGIRGLGEERPWKETVESRQLANVGDT